ncbi:MAG: Xaa-Pro peptidase family protein [Proteobacteria bacterium]|nr:Xaa-Pro peptidase family protein [Pseudomonadota bacterium]
MLEQIGAFEKVPKQDLLNRIDGLKSLMAEAKMGFALIWENVDRFYFTGTMQKGILVVPVDREPLFFIEQSAERAKMETSLDFMHVKNDKEIWEILGNKGFLKGTAGLELDVLPVATFERMKRGIGFGRHADVMPLIRELRIVKSPFEIEQIKMSGRMLSYVFKSAKDVVREGVTELDIDAMLVAEGRKLGHQGFLRMRGVNQEMMTLTAQSGFTGAVATYADVPIAGAGVTPAVPQGSSFKKVERGIPVTIDYGGGYNGYITDETRTFVVGKLKELFKKPYETTRAIIEDTEAWGREGVECTEIFSRAYRLVKKAHLQDYFMGHGEGQVSFIGHGLGLEINELPVITARHSRVLKEGMVFAFEPKFIIPGEGAIGVEVDFIVRQHCFERVTGDSIDIVYV